jgi:hypothetical protein
MHDRYTDDQAGPGDIGRRRAAAIAAIQETAEDVRSLETQILGPETAETKDVP